MSLEILFMDNVNGDLDHMPQPQLKPDVVIQNMMMQLHPAFKLSPSFLIMLLNGSGWAFKGLLSSMFMCDE